MWRYLIAVPLVFAAASWAETETRRVEDLEFDRVLVYGGVDVEIRQDEDTEVLVRGRAKDLDQEPFFVDGDTLVIGRTKARRHNDFRSVRFKIALPHLRHLQLKGSGDVYVKPLEAGELFVSLQGSGDIKLYGVDGEEVILRMSGSGDIQAAKMEAEELEVMVAGSGDIRLGSIDADTAMATISGSGDIATKGRGQCRALEVNVVGSGDVDMRGVDSDELEVNIVGSGSTRVGEVREHLGAIIMGSGDVHFSGDPRIERTILGSGELHRR